MQSLETSICRSWPLELWAGSATVVAVSGGPDSVALLNALQTISGNRAVLVVAHIDHGLRGMESDGDREFVSDLAQRRNLTCEIVRLSDVPTFTSEASEKTPVSEESLRKTRHRHLRRIAIQHNANWIATAHHADDVVETMLHRLLRGSGPRGLASIPPMRQLADNLTLVHPLLTVTRSQILQYIETHLLEFRIDRSNNSTAYTRNRIRHQLLPYLRSFVGTPNLDQRLWQTAQQIRDEHQSVESAAKSWLEANRVPEDRTGIRFPLSAFEGVPWCVAREGLVAVWHDFSWPLQSMNAKHWERLRLFLQSVSPDPHPRRTQLPGRINVTMRRGVVRFFQDTLHAD